MVLTDMQVTIHILLAFRVKIFLKNGIFLEVAPGPVNLWSEFAVILFDPVFFLLFPTGGLVGYNTPGGFRCYHFQLSYFVVAAAEEFYKIGVPRPIRSYCTLVICTH